MGRRSGKGLDVVGEVGQLMMAVPAPATVVLDVAVYKTACEDYKTILFYAGEVLKNYSAYEQWKSRLGKGDVDNEFILSCKERMEECLKSLRSYVEVRTRAGWD